MKNITEEQVLEILKTVKYPGLSRDIVSFGLIKSVRIDGASVMIDIKSPSPDPKISDQIKKEVENLCLISRLEWELAAAPLL